MKEEKFKITMHMISSLDGFIAKTDSSVAWFETSSEYDHSIDI